MPGGIRYLQDAVRKDPTMINEIHETLRTILSLSGVNSRQIYYEPLGWTEDEVRMLFFQQLRRKLNDVGIDLAPDIEECSRWCSPSWRAADHGRAEVLQPGVGDAVRQALAASPGRPGPAGKLQEYWISSS